MRAAWMAMLGAAVTVAGCYALGSVALAWSRAKLDRLERGSLAILVGASWMHLAIFAIMSAKLAYRATWWVLIGASILWAILKRPSEQTQAARKKGGRWLNAIMAVICVPYTVFYLANAWAPEMSPDGSSYHLGILARYLRAHGFERIETNMYSDLSQGVETVYAPAFSIGKHSAAALVHLALLIAFAIAIYAFGRRIGKTWVGAAAAAIVYISPVVGRDGTTAYIDAATAAIVFAAFYLLQIWDEQRDDRVLAIAGAMAGYAFAAKYTMGIMAVYATGFVLWRAKKIRPVLIVSAAAAVMIAPWLIKNWVLVRDPVAPFALEIFPSPYIHVLAIQDWAEWLRNYSIPNLWQWPLEVTVRGGFTQGIVGPVFLLLPLALLTLGDPWGRRMLFTGLILLATYPGNLGTRFLIPALPFFAFGIALVFERWKPLLALLVVAHAIASRPSEIERYGAPSVWRIFQFPYKAALGIASRETYLARGLGGYGMIRMIEEKVPPGEKVFSLTGIASSYTSREIIEAFPGAFNNLLFDALNVARMPDWQANRRLVFKFPEQRDQHIRIVLTARGGKLEQWNVHELRFYSHGAEVPRNGDWRLTSDPNPWEIGLAFDNSSVTRWRSWESGKPGMFIEVNFGRPESVDEVRMWTSRDYLWPLQFEIQTGGEGRWQKVSDHFEETEEKPRGFLGRAAMYEFRARGVRYLLVPDSDFTAAEFSEEPAVWGLLLIGRSGDLALYRILP